MVINFFVGHSCRDNRSIAHVLHVLINSRRTEMNTEWNFNEYVYSGTKFNVLTCRGMVHENNEDGTATEREWEWHISWQATATTTERDFSMTLTVYRSLKWLLGGY